MTVGEQDSRRDAAPAEMTMVLVVVPDPTERLNVRRLIAGDFGFEVREADGPAEALAAVREGSVAAILVSRPADDAAGSDLIRALRRERPDIPVVLMIADADLGVEAAAEPLRLGAAAFVSRERLADELPPILGRALRSASRASRRRRGLEGLVRLESRFLIAADAEAVAATLDVVQEQVEALGRWDGAEVLRMMIALDEALRQARSGEAGRADDHRTALTIVHEPDLSRFTIRDEGASFEVAPADGTLAPEELARPSVRGLLMMRSFMDEVRFPGGDEVELIKRTRPIPPPSASRPAPATAEGRGRETPADPDLDPGPTRAPLREPTGHGFARRLLDALPDAAYFVDQAGRILYWNDAAVILTGYSRDQMLHPTASVDLLAYTNWSGVPLARDDFPSFRAMRAGRAVELLLFLHRRDHRRVWVETRGSPVRDPSGVIAGGLVVLRDATSSIVVEEALKQARRAAESDSLTGLANRRSLDRMLDLHLQILAREGRPFCLIMADLDHFKAINDGWGHAVGDRALIAFATMLRNQIRAEDLAVRFGGEEFVVLLPDHALDVAARIAERLRVATASAAPPELLDRRLTASFGVAQAAPGESASQLVRRADATLYRAKSEGRDRVAVDDPEARPPS